MRCRAEGTRVTPTSTRERLVWVWWVRGRERRSGMPPSSTRASASLHSEREVVCLAFLDLCFLVDLGGGGGVGNEAGVGMVSMEQGKGMSKMPPLSTKDLPAYIARL